VADSRDRCPNTLRNARVDARGCWTLTGVRFAVNSAALEGGSKQVLAEDLEVLRANPGVKISVDGHTDSDGSEAYNQSLSTRRAAAVRDYFVSQGLKASRFRVRGDGETSPAVPNNSRENKRINRRVELSIID
jgi:OOP family OmpA-OmpF porin